MSLVTEDGSGLSNAESYASVPEADAYHAAQGNPAAWSGAATPDKESALRQATSYLDGVYTGRWRGLRAHEAQALAWPRCEAIDDDGFLIAAASVPVKLKNATAELALKVIGGASLFVDETTPGELSAKTLKVGAIEVSKTFVGGQGTQPSYPKAKSLLRSLLEPLGVRERA